MSIEAIAALGGAVEAAAGLVPAVPQASAGAFESVLGSLNDLNTQLLTGEQHVAQLASGQISSLPEVAISSEQTRLSFELMLAVRNKVLDAYQELMRMQV